MEILSVHVSPEWISSWSRMGRGIARAAVLAGLLALAGCARASQDELMFSSEPSSLTSRILDTQAARGARSDAMLHAVHFDGPALNHLGRQKLDLMIRDSGVPLPLVVYVDLAPSDAETGIRTEAVREYLTQAGLTAAQFRAVAGANARALHQAAPNIASLVKTENTAAPGGAAPQQAEAPLPTSAMPPKQ